MSNPFGDVEAEAIGATAVAVAEPDADVDLDVDSNAADETEDVAEAPPSTGTKVSGTKKVTATKKVSARQPVAEGYIAPVEAAKKLSEHLTAKARAAGEIEADEEIEVRPQVMYSYIKNNGPESKNPLPRYTDPALTGGRECVLILSELLTWWDTKDARVAARKVAAAEKAAKKAAAPKAEATAAAEAPSAPVEEAE